MITQILVTVCLMTGAPGFRGDPDRDCETYPIRLHEPMSPAACSTLQGQTAVLLALGTLLEDHHLARYTCIPGEPA